MATVDILMAAYNGEKYIAEQIESILAQTFTDWRLLIRDDGSSDNTPAIIEGYAAKYPGRINVIHDDAECHSPTKNFFELLKNAEADYVMFCDQDDVWLKYKVQITLDYMKEAERKNPGKPVMVFTGLQVVDAELRSLDMLLHLDFPETRYTFRELLPCNCAAGCTQMLNRVCYEGMGGFEDDIHYHDWWASLYASVFGVIVRVPMALILYRQHGGNAVGAGVNLERVPNIIVRLWRFICNPAPKINRRVWGRIKSMYKGYKHARVFCRRFSETMPRERVREFDEYSKLFGKSFAQRLTAMIKHRKLYHFTHNMRNASLLPLVIFGCE